jgi:hypothetical protein
MVDSRFWLLKEIASTVSLHRDLTGPPNVVYH